MILGKLIDLEKYRGISTNLDTAITSILNKDYLKGNLGKNSIDGENVFFNLIEFTSKNIEESNFEVHKEYIDIQVIIEGAEGFGYSLTTENLKNNNEYDAKIDCILFKGKLENIFNLSKEDFIIFFTGEPHMPGLKVNEKSKIKKAIYKVAL